jgi:hypothetical protein
MSDAPKNVELPKVPDAALIGCTDFAEMYENNKDAILARSGPVAERLR